MSKDLHQRDAAQARGSKLLLAMGIIVLLGALAYFILTLGRHAGPCTGAGLRCRQL